MPVTITTPPGHHHAIGTDTHRTIVPRPSWYHHCPHIAPSPCFGIRRGGGAHGMWACLLCLYLSLYSRRIWRCTQLGRWNGQKSAEGRGTVYILPTRRFCSTACSPSRWLIISRKVHVVGTFVCGYGWDSLPSHINLLPLLSVLLISIGAMLLLLFAFPSTTSASACLCRHHAIPSCHGIYHISQPFTR